MEDPKIAAVTEHDVQVFHTAEGTLLDDPVAEALNTKVEIKSKDAAEKKWEEEVRAQIAAKKGKPEPAKKLTKQQEEARQQQAAKEAAIRLSVGEANLDAVLAKAVIIEAVAASRKSAAQYIPEFSPLLIKLLAAPLVSALAMDLLSSFATCITSRLAPLAQTVAFTIIRSQSPVAALSKAWQSEPVDQMVIRVNRSVWVIAHQAPLEEYEFAFVFPLLEHILFSSALEGSALEDALVTLTYHSQLSALPSFPRVRLIKLLAHVMTTQSRLAHQASILLNDVCSVLSKHPLPYTDEILAIGQGILTDMVLLRTASLKALGHFNLAAATELTQSVWLASHDSLEQNAQLSKSLWAASGFSIKSDDCEKLVNFAVNEYETVRAMAGPALHGALQLHRAATSGVLKNTISRYHELLLPPRPVRDHLGNLLNITLPDEFHARVGLADAWAAIAGDLSHANCLELFDFNIHSAFADKNATARQAVLKAALKTVSGHGKELSDALIPKFQAYLDSKHTASAEHDAIRESVVVVMGALAQHLDKTDPKVPAIVNLLVTALSTPSEQVQEAVAGCLVPLVPALSADVSAALVRQLMSTLLENNTFPQRRGAAYGLAGAVKGLGVFHLKQQGILEALIEAIQDKKQAHRRESALMAFELLSTMLGRLFEAYVSGILPHLLVCFGDGNKDVRAATEEASRAIMSKLTGAGVKLILPSLLKALDDESWRTKAGSVELLGSMAFCAPKQLSTCLPSIVPRLVEVLTDTHSKVQQAGKDALTRIASVIKNPEIQNVVPLMIEALNDPNKNSHKFLARMLELTFLHVIDAPSLALIMPILQRAIRERSTEIKRMSAQIIGNMNSLTDPKELAPYLEDVIPGLKLALLDPVPEVRNVSAKSLGQMVKGMGEDKFADLLPWLFVQLKSEAGPVDRTGAAQGISEVLFALGTDRLATYMDEFVTGTSNSLAHVREGYLKLFIYLPFTFGDGFRPFVSRTIPCILRGLADNEEAVRDASMRSGQRIVDNFADAAVELLLPQLEKGMFDEHWRIRQSSVQLLGDLLFKISGCSGAKSTDDNDDDSNLGTEEARLALINTLGQERRNRVLSRLYMARSDVNLAVRQIALHVWKIIVTHTVRTVREIMPILINLIIDALGSDVSDQRVVAGRTLGELVRKLGERILSDILPILEEGLQSPDVHKRQGVCSGLCEILRSTTQEYIALFAGSFIPCIRAALCDKEHEVREAAAGAFSILHTSIGSEAVDGILPHMLLALEKPETTSDALAGLRELVGYKGNVILALLMPNLLAKRMTSFQAHALSSVISVAGPAVTKYLTQILSTLMHNLQDDKNEAWADVKEAAITLVRSVSEEESVMDFIDELVKTTKHPTARVRLVAVELLRELCETSQSDLAVYLPRIVECLARRFVDDGTDVISTAWGALNSVITNRIKADKLSYARMLRRVMGEIAADQPNHYIRGLALDRGATPFFDIYVDMILNSPDNESKLVAAEAYAEFVKYIDPAAHGGAYILKLAGPLLNNVQKYPSVSVREAVVAAIVAFVEHFSDKLKTMQVQIQSVFLKCIQDKASTRALRDSCATGLGLLAQFGKVDKMVKDLCDELKTPSTGQHESCLHALDLIAKRSAAAMAEPVRASIVAAASPFLSSNDEQQRTLSAHAVSRALEHTADTELFRATVEASILAPIAAGTANTWIIEHGRSTLLSDLLRRSAEKTMAAVDPARLQTELLRELRSDNVLVASHAGVAAAYLLRHLCVLGQEEGIPKLCQQIGAVLRDSVGTDVTVATLHALKLVFKTQQTRTDTLLGSLSPVLMMVIRQKAGPSRLVRCIAHV